MNYLEIAEEFVRQKFSEADLVLLAGSYVRGQQTPTSDLDLVIIKVELGAAYRETFRSRNMIIETFVHNKGSVVQWMEKDVKRRRPSLCQMISEGILIHGKPELAKEIKAIANGMFSAGPVPLDTQEDLIRRYRITDLLDDLIGSAKLDECMFVANVLVGEVISYELQRNRMWDVGPKRIPADYGAVFRKSYLDLLEGMRDLYCGEGKSKLVVWVIGILEKYGGRVDEGFSLGKESTDQR